MTCAECGYPTLNCQCEWEEYMEEDWEDSQNDEEPSEL